MGIIFLFKEYKITRLHLEFRISKMLKSLEIKPAVIVLGKNEKPIAWISTNQIMENTATKRGKFANRQIAYLTFKEHLEHFGCGRIEVQSHNLIPWKSLKH